jgi:hypothetical protein
MHSIEGPRLQFDSKSIDQLRALCRNGLPLEWLPLPDAARNERLQAAPVHGVGFACSHAECSPAFQFCEFAEYERQRILPDKRFCSFGLSRDIEVQSCREVGIQVIHRFSVLRKSSMGLVSLTGCLFNHSKWLFQSGSVAR